MDHFRPMGVLHIMTFASRDEDWEVAHPDWVAPDSGRSRGAPGLRRHPFVWAEMPKAKEGKRGDQKGIYGA